MFYKIGDKVRVKEGLNRDNCRHWVDALALHSGDIVTIIDIDDENEGIFCKENRWFWVFEAVEAELRKGEANMKKSEPQHLDIVVTRDGTPHYYFSDVKKLVAENGFLSLDEYNEDLDLGLIPSFDIVEVHRMECPELSTLNVREALSICPTTLLWKRVEMERATTSTISTPSYKLWKKSTQELATKRQLSTMWEYSPQEKRQRPPWVALASRCGVTFAKKGKNIKKNLQCRSPRLSKPIQPQDIHFLRFLLTKRQNFDIIYI